MLAEEYMFPDDAEKTLTNIIRSKMIGREVKYETITDNPEDEDESVVLSRSYNVNFNIKKIVEIIF